VKKYCRQRGREGKCAVFTATVWSRSRDLGSTPTFGTHVVASLDKALYDDTVCLVPSNKQKIKLKEVKNNRKWLALKWVQILFRLHVNKISHQKPKTECLNLYKHRVCASKMNTNVIKPMTSTPTKCTLKSRVRKPLNSERVRPFRQRIRLGWLKHVGMFAANLHLA